MSDHDPDGSGSTGTPDRGGMSRRGFIAGAAGLTGVALSGVWRGAPAAAATADASARGRQVGGHVFLQLERTVVGELKAFQGGNLVGVTEDDPPGRDPYVHKHIGGFKWEDISLKAGLGLKPAFYDWVSAFMLGDRRAHAGSIISTDGNFAIKQRLDFPSAVVTEVDWPALDASSKDPAYLTVKITPQSTSRRLATGQIKSGPPNQQKVWLPANFRLAIGELDCTHVSKIDAIAIKWSEADKIEVSPLGFTLSAAFGKTWLAFMDDFVLGGSDELAGKLEVLDPSLSTTLAFLELGHVGIYMLDTLGVQPSGTIPRLKAEMYNEEIAFTYGPG